MGDGGGGGEGGESAVITEDCALTPHLSAKQCTLKTGNCTEIILHIRRNFAR